MRKVNLTDIIPGDTIIDRAGKIITIARSDIADCPFMGRSLRGDTYSLGYEPVIRLDPHDLLDQDNQDTPHNA